MRSADAFAGVVLVYGSRRQRRAGGRGRDRRFERRRAATSSPGRRAYEGDAHAGRTETLDAPALRPDRVRLDRAEAGDTRPIGELLPDLRAGGVAAVSANGVLGDPAGATADEGAALLDHLTADLVATVEARWP